jgi:hypothetical protein
MTPAGPALTGDYNLNHVVDAADYVLWRKTTGGSVPQAYSGADGDGNTVVNSNDYTVWRSRFGNTPPGAGSGAQGLSDEAVGSGSSAASSGDTDSTSLAFAALASVTVVTPAPVAMIRANQSVATNEAASPDLLLATGDLAGGVNQPAENGIGSNAIEPITAHAIWDGVFELSMGELKPPLVAW